MPPALFSVLAAFDLHPFVDGIVNLPWSDLFKGIGGHILGLIVGFAFSWFLLLRKRRLALARLTRGDSDDVLFQSHHLHAIPGTDRFVLLFRNIAPTLKVDGLYDNPAASDIVRKLADKTTLSNPVLQTEGTLGFEVLNDAFGHIAGHLATTPFEREAWLFAMTCEDRQVVRRKCIRCFLIRPRDLEHFANWDWCRDHVLCEQPWHWYRIVALHQIASQWRAEDSRERMRDHSQDGLPLVDDHTVHRRIRTISAGIFTKEIPVGEPVTVPWQNQERELKRLGLHLSVAHPFPASPSVQPSLAQADATQH